VKIKTRVNIVYYTILGLLTATLINGCIEKVESGIPNWYLDKNTKQKCLNGVVYYLHYEGHHAFMAPVIDKETLMFVRCESGIKI